MLKNRRIGLSQSGVVQAFNKHGRREVYDWCDNAYEYVKQLDEEYSNWLCIPKSIRMTSIKPSGTVSLLNGSTPGIHFPEDEYYIRRIRFGKDSELLKTLSDSGGILGLSLYPHHLKDNTNCSLESFCEMVAKTAEIMDINNIGIGSDLCLNQPDEVVEWMRNGTWSKNKNYGEGSKNKPGFPKQPDWFEDARGFKNLETGLKKVGFSETETNGILGNNWYNFYKTI